MHQSGVPEEMPFSLCVDDRPWPEARLTYTPAEFSRLDNRWTGAGGFGLIVEGGLVKSYDLTVDGTGYVGIGATTTPGSLLSITGVANFVANSTSTLYNGLNVTGGCIAVSGTCLGTGGGIVTSITAGAGLLGGTITATGTISLNTGNSNTWSALQFFSANASSTNFSNFGTAYFGGTATSSFNSAGLLSLVSNGLSVGTNQLVVSGGNVGIGTTSPSNELEVAGPTAPATFTNTAGGAYEILLKNGVGGGITKLGTDSSNNFQFLTNAGVNALSVASLTGNVGVGTNRPSHSN
jgi:hypothetical protein